MNEQKTEEGVLLQTIPYLRDQRIIKVFTETHGLISLLVPKKSLHFLTDPFLIGEWIYEKGKNDLYRLIDGTVTDSLSHLRIEFSFLQAAGEIAQDLLKTQYPEKKGKDLYRLVTVYLKKLKNPLFPTTLLASFRLKLLLHDGLLAFERKCNQCDKKASLIERGESLCEEHVSLDSVAFSPAEWEILETLLTVRQFQQIEKTEVSEVLGRKIKNLFESSL